MKTAKELNEFTKGMLLVLKNTLSDRDDATVRVLVDTLAQAYGIPASYCPLR